MNENTEHKYKFVNINNDGWWLKLESCDDLCQYIKDTFGNRKGKIFEDFVYHYDMSTGTLNHGEYAETHGVLIQAQRTEVSFLTALERLYQEVGLTMLHKIQEDGKIYVNSVGGYNSVFDTSMETQTVWRTELVFPEYSKEDIRIKQFQGGTHWYAYVGDLQIKTDNGQTLKWNTYEEAYNEAIKIMK